jgi:hypothetical protein
MTVFTATAPNASLPVAPTFDSATRERVIELVEQVRAHQNETGAVASDHVHEVSQSLRQALTLLQPYTNTFPSLTICLQDMEDWLAGGLEQAPNMRHLAKHGLVMGDEGQEDAILTVTVTLNYSTRPTLEFIHLRRFEGAPAAELRHVYRCDGLMIAELLAATAGYGWESNCIVCFTETLAGGATMPDIMDIFFAAKNALRGKAILQPLMELVLAPGSFAELRAATLDDLRLIVPCKTVTHEWSHRHGVLALTEFRTLYEEQVTAGLEEARVELRGAHILLGLAEQCGEHADIYAMAAQFIIADRLLRYPYCAHPRENADAISGQYMFAQFVAKRLLTFNAGKIRFAGRCEMIDGLGQIVQEIDDLHYQMLTSAPSAAYQLVHEHITQYSLTFDADSAMQRSLFHEWLVNRAQGIVPQVMDWHAAMRQHVEAQA